MASGRNSYYSQAPQRQSLCIPHVHSSHAVVEAITFAHRIMARIYWLDLESSDNILKAKRIFRDTLTR
jgi:hypothetical protein